MNLIKHLKNIAKSAVIPALAGFFLSQPIGVLAADYFAAGVKLFDSQRYSEAAQYFKHVLRTNPKHTQAMYYLGASLQNSGDIAGAKSFYNHLIRNYPRSEGARYAATAMQTLNQSGASSAGANSGTVTNTSARRSSSSTDYIPDAESVGFRKSADQEHLMVNCRINGRNLPMIFDTGSTICMIGKNHLQQIGMAPPTGAPTNKVKAVGGVVDAWEVPAQIALGRIVRTVDLVVIEQLRNPLLGQSFYGDLKYEVDNARGQIAFKKPGGKADFVQAGSIDIPLTVEGSNLIVTAKVNGRPMPFYFDTGAGASIMPLQMMKAMGDQGFRKVGESDATGAAGTTKSERYEVDSIELGPIRKQGLVIAVSADYKYKYGLLGRDFFGNKRFTVDKANKKLHFYR
ncbi:MAG TPA: retroviral-like aspartic protease family protein [Candidatus Melainabacteria bacterium]|nr:retroviral-like aspartic protease family protein [Candidatus Melainabacteria bacterium]